MFAFVHVAKSEREAVASGAPRSARWYVRSSPRYSIRGAMKRFGVEDKVRRWIKRGMVDAVREDFQWCERAWWLSIDEKTVERVYDRRADPRRPDTMLSCLFPTSSGTDAA